MGIKDGGQNFSKRKERSKTYFSGPRPLDSQESGTEIVFPFFFFITGMIWVVLCRFKSIDEDAFTSVKSKLQGNILLIFNFYFTFYSNS